MVNQDKNILKEKNAWVATGDRTQGLRPLLSTLWPLSYDYPAATQHSPSVFELEKQAKITYDEGEGRGN